MSRVLITGCGSGIGRAAALEFTRRGHEVIATAREVDSIADLEVAERHQLDVTSDEQVAALVSRIGDVDVLVNNAGVGLHGPLEVVPMEAIENLYDINVLGTIRITKALLPSLRTRGKGTVFFVSSPAGRATRPLTGSYGSTKAAVDLIMESLSFELEDTGARVVLVAPGAVASGFGERRSTYSSDVEPYRTITEQWVRRRSASHTSHASTPEEVATVIADLHERETRPFSRHTVGEEAAALLDQRAECDDDTYRERVWAGLRPQG
ncbi:SDR family NAD(P)-dependent oxidoreductase [Streptomyces sp. UG1]|uniref:SDR family NAD(P)-dependent oxidoreductase n=1 Tax=Streptomyces sp. UG1 TaxID=3417652 RepID=UPI003CF670BD